MWNLNNPILNTDSYKPSHFYQLPEGTKQIVSYISARKANSKAGFADPLDKIMLFDLQAFIKQYLSTPITAAHIDEAERFLKAHGEPFCREGWEIILNEYDGYLPISIRAVPEGLPVPVTVPLAIIENTDARLPWLTQYVETALLRSVWYGSTVASVSWGLKRVIMEYVIKTSDTLESVLFKLHDFGARGASSKETAQIGGAAHILNFMGTDTMVGAMYLANMYGKGDEVLAYSIPATEHSTITSWTREGEVAAYYNFLKQSFDNGNKLIACVSDSYDIFEACSMWCDMAEFIKENDGKIIVRPDSGDPLEVLPGVLQILEQGFGFEKNSKGFKVINNAGVIWGDGINAKTIKEICELLVSLNYSVDNIAFGMGGALLQSHTRDDFGFAMKACAKVNASDEVVEVFKDPITDPGKKSFRGLVSTVTNGQETITIPADKLEEYEGNGYVDLMDQVFLNGALMRDTTIEDLRTAASNYLVA